jgi:anthranilate phosphoribosyltransferase
LTVVDAVQLIGGDRVRNADLLRQTIGMDVIAARDSARILAIQDVVSLNAGAALIAYDALSGQGLDGTLHDRVAAKLPRVREALASGAVAEVLKRWIALSQELMLKQ